MHPSNHSMTDDHLSRKKLTPNQANKRSPMRSPS
jgi:hypothetical protein